VGEGGEGKRALRRHYRPTSILHLFSPKSAELTEITTSDQFPQIIDRVIPRCSSPVEALFSLQK